MSGVLEHVEPVGAGNAESPAAAGFAGDDCDKRHREPRHKVEIVRYGLALTAFFGGNARVGARGVDYADYGSSELLGLTHEALCLAVTGGVGHAEASGDLRIERIAFFGDDVSDGLSFEVGQAADQRAVFGNRSPAVDGGAKCVEDGAGTDATRGAGETDALNGCRQSLRICLCLGRIY